MGQRPARQRRHQRRPRGAPRHHRRVDRDALGHPRAAHRGHGVVAGHRRRPPGPRARRAWRRPRSTSSCWPRAPPTWPSRPPRQPCTMHWACREAPSTSTRRAPGSSTRWSPPTGAVSAGRGPSGPAHRRRLRVALTDPDDRATAVLFADGAGAVVLEAERRGRPARRRPRRRRQRPRSSRPVPMAATWSWREKRCSAAPCGSRSNRPPTRWRAGQAHAPTTSPCSSPTRPTCASSKPPPHRLGHPHGPRGGGRRPDGQHLERLGPPGACRRGRCRPAAPR